MENEPDLPLVGNYPTEYAPASQQGIKRGGGKGTVESNFVSGKGRSSANGM
jgi:hypothetical protein